MRTVCFINHLKLQVGGKVSQNCIALGDVDGDSCNELVVGVSGRRDGTILIYKGRSDKPWWELGGMGDISCVTIGDACNQGKNSILVFSWNGQCYILDLYHSASGPNHTLKAVQLMPSIANVLIGDVDNNDKSELIVCHSDKAVTAYRWNDRFKKFVLLQRWRLKDLAGNITIHVGSDQKKPSLLVSQPGCTYAVLQLDFESSGDAEIESDAISADGCVQYTQLSSSSRLQNPDISAKILGGILKSGEKASGYFALCTLDGTLKLMEGSNNLWSVQVDHRLFAMNKLDVLGDNREEVIVCASDGWTYIVDHDRNVVRYRFPDHVQAFCTGTFCIDGDGVNSPCLVYVNFRNYVYLYYDVTLPFLRVTDFVSATENDDVIAAHFAKLGLKSYKDKAKYLRSCLDNLNTKND